MNRTAIPALVVLGIAGATPGQTFERFPVGTVTNRMSDRREAAETRSRSPASESALSRAR
jgi:hypothetical protein